MNSDESADPDSRVRFQAGSQAADATARVRALRRRLSGSALSSLFIPLAKWNAYFHPHSPLLATHQFTAVVRAIEFAQPGPRIRQTDPFFNRAVLPQTRSIVGHDQCQCAILAARLQFNETRPGARLDAMANRILDERL